MTRKEFEQALREEAGGIEQAIRDELDSLIPLVASKNEDYAGDEPLVCWTEDGLDGIRQRVWDKYCRLRTMCRRGETTEEKAREVIIDFAGYMLCSLIWLKYGNDPLIKEEK